MSKREATVVKFEGSAKVRALKHNGPMRSAKEFSDALGYSGVSSFWNAVETGIVPQPDFVTGRLRKGCWKLSVLEAEVKKKIGKA